jgi:disulfide bond formation protein DsbB
MSERETCVYTVHFAVPTMYDAGPTRNDPMTTTPPVATVRVFPAFAVAVLALAGSLWLSMGMALKACPLCFYQRTFVMGVVAVLGIGMLAGSRHRPVLPILALPLAVGGLTVAVFHVWLEVRGRLECPAGVMGVGTAPQQSLAVLAVLTVLIAIAAVRAGRAGESRSATVVGALLGVMLGVASIVSSPPLPPVPAMAYETPLEMCRPPFGPQ